MWLGLPANQPALSGLSLEHVRHRARIPDDARPVGERVRSPGHAPRRWQEVLPLLRTAIAGMNPEN